MSAAESSAQKVDQEVSEFSFQILRSREGLRSRVARLSSTQVICQIGSLKCRMIARQIGGQG